MGAAAQQERARISGALPYRGLLDLTNFAEALENAVMGQKLGELFINPESWIQTFALQ